MHTSPTPAFFFGYHPKDQNHSQLLGPRVAATIFRGWVYEILALVRSVKEHIISDLTASSSPLSSVCLIDNLEIKFHTTRKRNGLPSGARGNMYFTLNFHAYTTNVNPMHQVPLPPIASHPNR